MFAGLSGCRAEHARLLLAAVCDLLQECSNLFYLIEVEQRLDLLSALAGSRKHVPDQFPAREHDLRMRLHVLEHFERRGIAWRDVRNCWGLQAPLDGDGLT